MANARPGSKYNKMVPVKVSGSDPNEQMKVADEGNFGKLRSIRIEPAANGYTVSSDHDPHPSMLKKVGKGMASPSTYRAPTQHVFPDAKGVLDHVKTKMAAHESWK